MLNRVLQPDSAFVRGLRWIQRKAVVSESVRAFLEDGDQVSICVLTRGLFITAFLNICLLAFMLLIVAAAVLAVGLVNALGGIILQHIFGVADAMQLAEAFLGWLVFEKDGQFSLMAIFNLLTGIATIAVVVFSILGYRKYMEHRRDNVDRVAKRAKNRRKRGIIDIDASKVGDTIDISDVLNAARGKICFKVSLPISAESLYRHSNYHCMFEDHWTDTVHYIDENGVRHKLKRSDDILEGVILIGWAYLAKDDIQIPVLQGVVPKN